MDFLNPLIIFSLGFFASFVGTSTGGVGVLVVPSLILLGLSPHAAIATTRLSVFAGDLVTLPQYHKAGKIDKTLVVPILVISLVGASLGSVFLLWTPGPLAERLLGLFILLTLLFTVLKKNVGLEERPSPTPFVRMSGYAMLFLLSILGAYFSAATGLLGRTTLLICFGQTYLQSAATRKIQGTAIGIASILIYAWNGVLALDTAAVLVPAVVLGSYLGTILALKKGNAWVRILFLGMVLFASIQLLL